VCTPLASSSPFKISAKRNYNLKLRAHSEVFRVPLLPRGCSLQAASPATQQAKSQGRKAKKNPKVLHQRHAARRPAAGGDGSGRARAAGAEGHPEPGSDGRPGSPEKRPPSLQILWLLLGEDGPLALFRRSFLLL